MTDYKLSWNDHFEYVCGKTSKRIYFLVFLKRAGRWPSDLINNYKTIIRSVLEYACIGVASSHNKTTITSNWTYSKQMSQYCRPDFTYEKAMTINNLVTIQERREVWYEKSFMSIQHKSHWLHYLLPPPRDVLSYNILGNMNLLQSQPTGIWDHQLIMDFLTFNKWYVLTTSQQSVTI